MKVKSLHLDLLKYLETRNLKKKWDKQVSIFLKDPRHPSLHTEILSPRERKIYSFRIDQKYRAIFVIRGDEAEIIDINDHYQ